MSGAMEDEMSVHRVFVPTWPEFYTWHKDELETLYLSGLWHHAQLHGQGGARSPSPRDWEPEDDDCQPRAHMLVEGARPGWVPAMLPYMEVVVLAVADERRFDERIIVDPQRARAGLDAFNRRIRDRMSRLPLPFVGRLVVAIRDQGSTRRLAQRVWDVEIGTTMPAWDPDVRTLIEGYRGREKEARRREKEAYAMVSEAYQAMRQMFGASAEVIHAGAALSREAVQLRQMRERLDQAQSGSEMVKFMREVLPMLAPFIQKALANEPGQARPGSQSLSKPWAVGTPQGSRPWSVPGGSYGDVVIEPEDDPFWIEPGPDPHENDDETMDEASGWETAPDTEWEPEEHEGHDRSVDQERWDDELEDDWDESGGAHHHDGYGEIVEAGNDARPPSPFGPIE